ncbi:MAG: Rrf2 family transcriptional regulator [Bacteroidales bacterium]|nr:Rrf2 family transcriptional regulator [Bacteroidales bacterium]
MNLTKTTSYSLNVLNYMAQNREVICSANYLHEKLKIPHQYLRQLLTKLSKDGFIHSTRGRNGGFVFSKKISEIFLADIIESTEGLDSFNKCMLGFSDCPFDSKCAMHDFWVDTRERIINELKTKSLEDLILKK